jgi:REP element-mobilizing transposase RayT
MTDKGYRIHDQQGIYFVTLQVVNWIDVFTRKFYRDVFIDNLKYYQQHQGLKIYGFVIMSNHMHLILSATESKYDLSTLISNIKRLTTKQIIKAMEEKEFVESRKEWLLQLFVDAANKHVRNSMYQVWTHENHPIVVDSEDLFHQKLEYIHNNPVVAGIVSQPEHYIYSSAANYFGLNGLIRIDRFESYNRSL